MSLIQETDLKIYRGVRETHQSNLPLQSREKTALFSTWCYHGGEAGKRKGRKKTHKDLRKKFQAQAVEWKGHKEVLESFVSNQETNSSPGPSPVWPLVICSVFMTRLSPCSSIYDWYARLAWEIQTRQANKKAFHGLQPSLHSFEGKNDGPAAWVSLPSYAQSESAMWAATKWHLSELIRLIPKPYTPCLHAYAHVITKNSALHLRRVGDSFFAPQKP